jgi:hypothetical protein
VPYALEKIGLGQSVGANDWDAGYGQPASGTKDYWPLAPKFSPNLKNSGGTPPSTVGQVHPDANQLYDNGDWADNANNDGGSSGA